MGLATEPLGWWPLAWVALVPLWVSVVRRRSPGWVTAAWGLGYYGFSLFWITGIHPMTWMGVPWLASLAIAIFCWTFITLWGTALTVAWGWLLRKLAPPPGWVRVLVGTALWCGLEAIWSSGPLWWSSLALTQSFGNLPVLHLSQLSGPSAVVAVIVAVNGAIAEIGLANRKRRRLYWMPLLIFAIAHLVGFGLYLRPLADDPQFGLRVGIIQGNVPNAIKLNPEGWRRALDGYTRGYLELSDRGVDAVLTPETALPFMWTQSSRNNLAFDQAILQRGVPAWVGGFGDAADGFTNSLFAIDGNGEIIGRYDKANLVPLGEFIPFENILGRLINRLSPLDARLVAGEKFQVFETGFGTAIAGICYDSTFPEHFRHQAAAGGEFILTASNDSHYSAMMLAQHHAQDVMRAIESDRWTLRATNTGYSGVVDPHGRTLWISGMDTYELHDETVYRRRTRTLYVRWGDWLAVLLLVGGAIAISIHRLSTSKD
ncbi:MAG: apolipoprotein N-acyltransferase [Limnospira sp.]